MLNNFIGNIRTALASIVKQGIAEYMDSDYYLDERQEDIVRNRDYRAGVQKQPLRVKKGTDDNIIVNYIGLMVDRAVALLMGDGVQFDLPGDEETDADRYIARVWELNKRDELLQDIAEYGAVGGTVSLRINPGRITVEDGEFPELSAIDPLHLEIITNPDNYRDVVAYSISYIIDIEEENGRKSKRRRQQVIAKAVLEDNLDSVWEIHDYLQDKNGVMQEMEGSPQLWEYPFPPIIAWKNLPQPGTPYGRADITDDIVDIQDALNMQYSNINKIGRLQSHQRIWAKMLGETNTALWGPDKFLETRNPDAEINVVEAGKGISDLREFAADLQEAMMTIARSADPSVFKDKVGQLTNFGLKVLYKDALDKLGTKRKLYGEALKEVNHRLLVLNGMDGDPGEVKWADPLPSSDKDVVDTQQVEIGLGTLSKQTAAEERGRDWDTEQERIDSEKMGENNAGNILVSNFFAGRNAQNR